MTWHIDGSRQGRDLSAPIGAADAIFTQFALTGSRRRPRRFESFRRMDVTIVDALIDLIAERPTIWNKRDQKHSCRLEVEKCWKEIGAALKVDGMYCFSDNVCGARSSERVGVSERECVCGNSMNYDAVNSI